MNNLLTTKNSKVLSIADMSEHYKPENLQHICNFNVPTPGTLVEERVIRKAGPYLLSPNFRSPIVSGISQYLCRKENTNMYYTIKILPLKSGNDTTLYSDLMAREILHTEYSLLTMLYNVEGIAKMHKIFKDYALEEKQVDQNCIYTGKVVQRICMVLDCYTPPDYCSELINLQHYVIQQKRLSEKQAITIFHYIILKVKDLHDRNIVHRDLKLGNFLYNKQTHEVTLFNFGLGIHLPNENFLLTDQKGSPAYISPDVISGKPYTGKPSDMWALGVLLFAMLYGQFPFHDTNSETLFDKIRSGDYVIPMGEKISVLTVQLIRGLLTLNPIQRFTAKRALEQVFLIASEFRSSCRDETLQVVPDIQSRVKDNEKFFDRSHYLHSEPEKIIKINLFNVKKYEATLQEVGTQIPIQQINQDAKVITPLEMMHFTQLLERIPHSVTPLKITMTRDEFRQVPEFVPNMNEHQTPSQHIHKHLVGTGPDRIRSRRGAHRRIGMRERENQESAN